jgi:hypothetical protein
LRISASAHAHPFRYRVLDKAVRKAEGNQRQFVKNIAEKLNQRPA